MKHGFTLIELSIVLVIIGLIAGSVLVGKDLIKAASQRSQISQIEKLTTAINTFRIKYNCLPGDCSSATAFGLGSNTSWHNGDGNRVVVGVNGMVRCYYPVTRQKEYTNLYLHLSMAQLIEGDYEGYQGEANNNCPADDVMKARLLQSNLSKDLFVFAGAIPVYNANGPNDPIYITHLKDGGQGFGLASLDSSVTANKLISRLDVYDAQAIDLKIDDGVPYTGNVGLSPLNTNGSWTSLVAMATSTAPQSCVRATYAIAAACTVTNPHIMSALMFYNRF